MLFNTTWLRGLNKIPEVENKILSISNLVKNGDFANKEQEVENKKTNVSNFIIKYGLDKSDLME